jgi:hypothetical protein
MGPHMKKNPHPYRNNSGLSLIQANDGREAMLLKMRGRLAGLSEVHVQATQKRRVAVRKSAFGWGWRIGVAAILMLANILYFAPGTEGTAKARAKHAPVLPKPSPALDVNEQALYWAFAMYDFDQLQAKFGVTKMTVVNTAEAAEHLRALLPKVDERTRSLIAQYTYQTRSGI